MWRLPRPGSSPLKDLLSGEHAIHQAAAAPALRRSLGVHGLGRDCPSHDENQQSCRVAAPVAFGEASSLSSTRTSDSPSLIAGPDGLLGRWHPLPTSR
jgi:hypothetical protein